MRNIKIITLQSDSMEEFLSKTNPYTILSSSSFHKEESYLTTENEPMQRARMRTRTVTYVTVILELEEEKPPQEKPIARTTL